MKSILGKAFFLSFLFLVSIAGVVLGCGGGGGSGENSPQGSGENEEGGEVITDTPAEPGDDALDETEEDSQTGTPTTL